MISEQRGWLAPAIVAHLRAFQLKETTNVLASAAPTCQLERFALDLSNVAARRELFQQLGRRADKALIVTEGLLIYFTEDVTTPKLLIQRGHKNHDASGYC